MHSWRLIDTGPLDGPANMALDEALLSCFDKERSRPLLRLYGWAPPALSVGRYQAAGAALKLDLCAEEDVPVVRRMTGGGIIYHAQELTYSIVCAPEHLGLSGVKDGFRRLCGFLLGTYRRLGLDASFAVDRNQAGERLGAILQHGSIPLESRVLHGLRYLKEPAPGAEGSVSLAELGVTPELSQLKQMLVESFQECLGVSLSAESPSEEELRAAGGLEAKKYRSSRWNMDGQL